MGFHRQLLNRWQNLLNWWPGGCLCSMLFQPYQWFFPVFFGAIIYKAWNSSIVRIQYYKIHTDVKLSAQSNFRILSITLKSFLVLREINSSISSLRQSDICFVSIVFPLLEMSHKFSNATCSLLCLASALNKFICMFQYIHFSSWVVFSYFCLPFTSWWTFGLSPQPLVIMHIAAMNIRVQVFV